MFENVIRGINVNMFYKHSIRSIRSMRKFLVQLFPWVKHNTRVFFQSNANDIKYVSDLNYVHLVSFLADGVHEEFWFSVSWVSSQLNFKQEYDTRKEVIVQYTHSFQTNRNKPELLQWIPMGLHREKMYK